MNDGYKWEVAHLNFLRCNFATVQMCNCATAVFHPRLTTSHTEITNTIIKNLEGSILREIST